MSSTKFDKISPALNSKKQIEGTVSIEIELVARDGTIIAGAKGHASKTGRSNETTVAGASIGDKIGRAHV